jgi:hypothetical protein
MNKTFIWTVLILPALLLAQAEKKQDVWDPLKFFIGTWEGTGEGKSGVSEVLKEFQFVLGGKYLRMTTKANFEPQENNPKGEVHEDFGYISYDRSRKKFVFRQFHIEGFINQYVLESISEDGKTIRWVAEKMENAPPDWKVELIYTIKEKNTLEESFNLGMPERDFECYNLNRLKRKK